MSAFDLEAEVKRATAAYLSLEGPHIPRSILKQPREEAEPTLAERLLGRPVYRETRRADMREMMRADRAGADDGCD